MLQFNKLTKLRQLHLISFHIYVGKIWLPAIYQNVLCSVGSKLRYDNYFLFFFYFFLITTRRKVSLLLLYSCASFYKLDLKPMSLLLAKSCPNVKTYSKNWAEPTRNSLVCNGMFKLKSIRYFENFVLKESQIFIYRTFVHHQRSSWFY